MKRSPKSLKRTSPKSPGRPKSPKRHSPKSPSKPKSLKRASSPKSLKKWPQPKPMREKDYEIEMTEFTPKSPKRSPKKVKASSPIKSKTPKNIKNLPCDLLLQIANNLSPEEYLRLSEASQYNYNCLKHGRQYEQTEKDLKKIKVDFLKEQMDLVRRDGLEIRRIKDPPENVQLAAVKQNGHKWTLCSIY